MHVCVTMMKNVVVSTALILALSMTLVLASDESTTSEKILAEIMRILKDDGMLEAVEAVKYQSSNVENLETARLQGAEDPEEPDENTAEGLQTAHVQSQDEILAEMMSIVKEEEMILAKQMQNWNAIYSESQSKSKEAADPICTAFELYREENFLNAFEVAMVITVLNDIVLSNHVKTNCIGKNNKEATSYNLGFTVGEKIREISAY